MFAFAIWDERQQRLILVRDRLGIKPIYYAQLGGDLVFACEIKSLLAAPEVDGAVDDDALAAYLALRYVPGAADAVPRRPQAAAGHVAHLVESGRVGIAAATGICRRCRRTTPRRRPRPRRRRAARARRLRHASCG